MREGTQGIVLAVCTRNHPKESGMPLQISNVSLAQLFGLSFAKSSSGSVFLAAVESVHVSRQVGARVEGNRRGMKWIYLVSR